jgi:hypothetical protein
MCTTISAWHATARRAVQPAHSSADPSSKMVNSDGQAVGGVHDITKTKVSRVYSSPLFDYQLALAARALG